MQAASCLLLVQESVSFGCNSAAAIQDGEGAQVYQMLAAAKRGWQFAVRLLLLLLLKVGLEGGD